MNDTQHSSPSGPTHAPRILVTGAARRVGAEIARCLHAAGARVVLHYRSSAGEAEALAASLNALRADSAFTVRGDLARFGAAEDIAAQVLARGEGLDGLVNNASSFFPTPIGGIDRAAWDELVGSNLMGPLFLSQALAPALRRAGGAIVNIVDIHADWPLTGYTVYNVAKGGSPRSPDRWPSSSRPRSASMAWRRGRSTGRKTGSFPPRSANGSSHTPCSSAWDRLPTLRARYDF